MKKILALLMSCGAMATAFSQNITVKVNGNKNQQVVIDGRSYTVDNTAASADRTFTITDLLTGQHSIKVIRANKAANATTSFTTRDGFDAMITITASGAVQVKEKKGTDLSGRTPMSDANFATLLRGVRNHVRNSSRITAATTALSNTNNYYTTAQLRMLLESFSDDDKRMELAQMGYDHVTDKMNFATLNTLFTSQQYKNDLTAFISNRGGNDVVYSYSESFRIPMADASFKASLEDIQAQWQEGARLSTIIDIMDNTSHYFTTSQVMQLISQVSDEGSRLHLAKAGYSRVTDPENYAQVYSLFYDKEAIANLSAYIGANANNAAPVSNIHNAGKLPMTDAAFTSIYNNARNHFRTTSILKEVRNAFANPANYFTSYQSRQLIAMVTGEANRLQMAKAAYRGVTDANNFEAQMSDLLTLQSSRDELSRYIVAYK